MLESLKIKFLHDDDEEEDNGRKKEKDEDETAASTEEDSPLVEALSTVSPTEVLFEQVNEARLADVCRLLSRAEWTAKLKSLTMCWSSHSRQPTIDSVERLREALIAAFGTKKISCV